MTGGRVTGADSIAEMIRELRHSVDARLFEGEMTQLSEMARRVSTFASAAVALADRDRYSIIV